MRLLLITMILISAQACTHRKDKQTCVSECKDRGAEYVGMVPDGVRISGGLGPDTTHDVCQCR